MNSRTNLLLSSPQILRAASELALARIRHLAVDPDYVSRQNELAAALRPLAVDMSRGTDEKRVMLVSYFITRVAALMPFRSDCLIQALAGQRWLRALGIPALITIGVRRAADGEFESHAWLTCDDRIAIGGDVSDFSEILEPGRGNYPRGID